MDKVQKLVEIAKEIEECKVCKVGKSGRAVPGEGNPDADVVFIGEAPGRNEALEGRPFIGRSGKYLRSLINKIGLREDEVFITSPVKYLPDKGTPSILDIVHGRIHLEKQLNIIAPKFIVLLGAVASFGVLDQKIPVVKLHGTIIDKNDRLHFITLHPAAAIRFPSLGKVIEEDFKKLKTLIS